MTEWRSVGYSWYPLIFFIIQLPNANAIDRNNKSNLNSINTVSQKKCKVDRKGTVF